jgi:predicted RNA binding protein YcfA (HicA-like mRNA interferase family)
MGKFEKLIQKLLSGLSDTNFNFNDLCSILIRFNFKERIKGSHHIFYRDDIEDIINIQPDKANAKPYHVKQVQEI